MATTKYSPELLWRVHKACVQGEKLCTLAREYGLNPSMLSKRLREFRQHRRARGEYL